VKARFALALLLLAAACARQPAAVLPQNRGCALLVGGVGPGFADPKIDEFWFRVNREVTQRLQARLFDQYRAEALFVEPKDRARTRELVGAELAKKKCNRILQVAHDVNVDIQGNYFRFDVTLLEATPTTRGIYEKHYRFARTLEVMKSFSTAAFGDQVFKDLEASGALQAIRR